MPTDTLDAVAELAALADERQNTAVRLVAVARELDAIAADLAAADAEIRARRYQAGLPPASGPTARELAAEVLVGHLGALRPHLPFVSRDSADRAEEQLLASPDAKVVR